MHRTKNCLTHFLPQYFLQVWRGMAWVTDGIEEEDEDTRMSMYDKMEQVCQLKKN